MSGLELATWAVRVVLALTLGGLLGLLSGLALQAVREALDRGRPEREALAARWIARDARLRQTSRSGGHRNRKRTHP